MDTPLAALDLRWPPGIWYLNAGQQLQITSVRSRSELPRTTDTDQDSMSRSRLEREIEKLVVSFTALKVKVDSNILDTY